MPTIDEIAALLATRNLAGFVGLKEDQWFDAKVPPGYDLGTEAGRFELAKDVSSFANAEGGHLIIGLTTADVPGEQTEQVNGVDLLAEAAFNVGAIQGVLNEYLHPRLQGLTVVWVQDLATAGQGVGVISIPALENDRRFVLMKRVLDAGTLLPQIVFGIAVRRNSNSIPLTVEQLYRMCQDGRSSVPAPHLRIVSDASWDAVHRRLEGARAIYLRTNKGLLWGRPTSGIESKYLLSGLARCGSCGGSLVVRSRASGAPGRRRRRAFFYTCSSFHHRGAAVCANSLEMSLQVADDEERGAQLATDLERLTAAVLAGGEAATLVQAMKAREKELTTVRASLSRLAPPQRAQRADGDAIALLTERLTEWRHLLRAHVPQARQMIRKLIEGRIVFTPNTDTRRYAFSIPGTLARFFNGLVNPQGMASPRGTATRWSPPFSGIAA